MTEVVVVPDEGSESTADASVALTAGEALATADDAADTATEAEETAELAEETAEAALETAWDAHSAVDELRYEMMTGLTELRETIASMRPASVVVEEVSVAPEVVEKEAPAPAAPAEPRKSSWGNDAWFGDR